MDLMYYILSPFSWLLNFFYSFTQSYGVSLILFSLVVKIILFPLTIKGKKSMIQMNLLSGKMQQLQKQYGKDQQRYQLELSRLYEKEKVNPMGGCLWSMIPMFILIPLYFIIREPLKYLMGLTVEQIETVATTLNWSTVAVSNGWIREAGETFASTIGAYNQMFLASLINSENIAQVTAALGGGTHVFAMNFHFLGLDLAMIPTWKIWDNPTGPVIGAFILVLISAFSSVIMSKISTMTNQMNNQELSEQAKSTNRTMMIIMPLMSLWIGFTMPVGLCIYWISNSVFSMLQEIVAGRVLKKDYEAARAAAAEQARLEKEEEKRRKEEARLERERRLAEEKKNRGKKKSGPKKEVQPGVDKSASREGLRAYARGRAYDPNRFGGVTPYHDPNGPAKPEAEKEEPEDVTGEESPDMPAALSAPESVHDSAPDGEFAEMENWDEMDVGDMDADDDDDDKESV